MLQELAAETGQRQLLQHMFEQAPGFMALLETPGHRISVANKAFEDLVGMSNLVGTPIGEIVPEGVGDRLGSIIRDADRSGDAFVAHAFALRVARSAGRMEDVLVDLVVQPLADGGGVFIQGHNVSEDNRNEILRNAHNRVLELAIGDNPLEQTLGALIGIVESTSQTGVLGSILLLDGKHLRHGAAPSLPQAYCEAIDGAEIGPCAGSCGTAAFRATPVFVSDIAADPLWTNFRDVALPHGLRACWSTPILTRGRRVLGTFAMYHREPREPTVRDLMLVDLVTQTATLVIDRERAHAALQNIAATAQETAH